MAEICQEPDCALGAVFIDGCAHKFLFYGVTNQPTQPGVGYPFNISIAVIFSFTKHAKGRCIQLCFNDQASAAVFG